MRDGAPAAAVRMVVIMSSRSIQLGEGGRGVLLPGTWHPSAEQLASLLDGGASVTVVFQADRGLGDREGFPQGGCGLLLLRCGMELSVMRSAALAKNQRISPATRCE